MMDDNETNRAMEIWDLHCHLSGVPGSAPEERLERLLACADRVGIRRVCVFMGMEWSYDPSPEKLRRDNDEVLRAIRRFPERAFGFAYLNPKHLKESLAELDRCVSAGPMVGIKLWVAQRCGSPELDTIIKRAAELKALIFQHTWMKVGGNLPGESTPLDLAALAARHPGVPMVCGHSGGDWERGLRAIRPYRNIYAELGGGDPTAGFTEMAVRELGAERVLFGSDAGGRSFASQLAKVRGAAIPEEARRLILGENLKRLLRPILEQKGMK